ncbi:MAG: O-antigen ligase domain-containing protein [Kaiparowitsia implicata GSE-PSE-MK54-09C]|jgi:hypothetical protein|nr:O-antigen ligase domain-containing protein [Kaiparowitsia implicata GSE-PSE-MK54-09C]
MPSKLSSAWTVIAIFIAISLASLVVAPQFLNLIFPSTAVLAGFFLYANSPLTYMGFTWWIWFLSPFARRLADYHSTYTEPSPILLAPYLVTLISALTFTQKSIKVENKTDTCFLLAFLGTVYALFIGLVRSPYTSVLTSFLEWSCPIFFGFYLYSRWREYPSLKQHTQNIFLWCVLLTGLYGVFQYLVLPDWDRVWLETNILMTENARAFGDPEPLRIRVWSTMNGPGVYSQVMMAGLLLILSRESSLNLPATAVGYLSFLLTLVRSAWLGWLVGLALLFSSLKSSLQIRLVLTLAIALMCSIPLIFLEPFSDLVVERLQTFTTLESDGSANARLGHYSRMLGAALSNVLGSGFGYSHGLLDSGILDLTLTLGWLGGGLYTGGVVLILIKLFRDDSLKNDTFAGASLAVSFGLIIQMLFGSTMTGLPGMILWGFMGMGMAFQRYTGSPQFYKGQRVSKSTLV